MYKYIQDLHTCIYDITFKFYILCIFANCINIIFYKWSCVFISKQLNLNIIFVLWCVCVCVLCGWVLCWCVCGGWFVWVMCAVCWVWCGVRVCVVCVVLGLWGVWCVLFGCAVWVCLCVVWGCVRAGCARVWESVCVGVWGWCGLCVGVCVCVCSVWSVWSVGVCGVWSVWSVCLCVCVCCVCVCVWCGWLCVILCEWGVGCVGGWWCCWVLGWWWWLWCCCGGGVFWEVVWGVCVCEGVCVVWGCVLVVCGGGVCECVYWGVLYSSLTTPPGRSRSQLAGGYAAVGADEGWGVCRSAVPPAERSSPAAEDPPHISFKPVCRALLLAASARRYARTVAGPAHAPLNQCISIRLLTNVQTHKHFEKQVALLPTTSSENLELSFILHPS